MYGLWNYIYKVESRQKIMRRQRVGKRVKLIQSPMSTTTQHVARVLSTRYLLICGLFSKIIIFCNMQNYCISIRFSSWIIISNIQKAIFLILIINFPFHICYPVNYSSSCQLQKTTCSSPYPIATEVSALKPEWRSDSSHEYACCVWSSDWLIEKGCHIVSRRVTILALSLSPTQTPSWPLF